MGWGEFLDGVESGEEGDGSDASVAGGFHIVDHVANKGGFRGIELVFSEDRADFFPFVVDLDVGGLEGVANAKAGRLEIEMRGLDGAEKKDAVAGGSAEIEDFQGTGEKLNVVVQAEEKAFVEGFEAFFGGFGEEFRVESREGEAEVAAEFFQREGGLAIFAENEIGGAPDRAEIVSERAGPVEEKITDHVWKRRARSFAPGKHCRRWLRMRFFQAVSSS